MAKIAIKLFLIDILKSITLFKVFFGSDPVYSDELSNTFKTIGKMKNRGSFGAYYKLSNNLGIKLLEMGFDTYEDALNSSEFYNAKKEAELLVEAKKRFSRIPKCYGVKIVKDVYYQIGILLQHLGDITLESLKLPNNYEIMRILESELKNLGVIHQDIHSKNIMYFKKNYWIIDFSPCSIKIE